MESGRSVTSAVRRRTGRRRRAAAGAAVVVLGVAAVVGWAGSRGYVPPVWEGGWGCSDVGYPDPPPSFDDLVEVHGESPYCARLVRGEAWF